MDTKRKVYKKSSKKILIDSCMICNRDNKCIYCISESPINDTIEKISFLIKSGVFFNKTPDKNIENLRKTYQSLAKDSNIFL